MEVHYRVSDFQIHQYRTISEAFIINIEYRVFGLIGYRTSQYVHLLRPGTYYCSKIFKNAFFYSSLMFPNLLFQILRLGVEKGLITSTTQIYANTGEELKASSVAINYKGGMLAGSVASPRSDLL